MSRASGGTLRRVLAVLVGFLLIAGLSSSAQAKAHRDGVPVDLQYYASTAPADPYNSDTSSLHVSVTAGSTTTQSYAHLALHYLGENARISSARLNLTITTKSAAPSSSVYQTYNVSQDQAIVQACVLTDQLSDSFDPSSPPAFDCSQGSTTGVVLKDGTWDFDLTQLLPYWRAHGNTGLALVPVIADSQSSWAISFVKTGSVAEAVYTLPPTENPSTSSSDNSAPPVAPAVIDPPTAAVVTQPMPVEPTQPAEVTLPPAPRVAAPPITEAVPTVAPGETQPANPWPLLVGGLLVAAGAVAVAHRGALSTKVFGPAVTVFRAHPAPYALAAAALVWTTTFAGYSVLHRPEASAAVAAEATPEAVTTTGALPFPASTTADPAAPSPGPASPLANPSAAGPVVSPTPESKQEFQGKGEWKTISGVNVFFPADGGPPVADLYQGAADTIGISSNEIKLCEHAAMTYGDAFNINASDLNVYWDDVNAHGGIDGRKVTVTYQNDNYDPGTAVQAAQACADQGVATILGGIGWDQTPAVRQWAEQNKQLYFHNSAVQKGSAGLHYSFSFGAPVEQFGHWFAQIVHDAYPGKKVAILWRQSPNWQPARTTFLADAKKYGNPVVYDQPVQLNQGNYTQELIQARSAGAEVVFALENSLSAIEMVKQAQAQNWYPGWALVGANITTNTLGSAALDQPIVSTSLLDYYTHGYYGGGYAAVAKYIKEFEALYAQRDPNADLGGDGGDILYSNWEFNRVLADIIRTCGKDCTRNKLAGIILAGYHKTVQPLCGYDFDTGDHHWGYHRTQYVKVFKDPAGNAAWQVVQRCKESF